MIAIFDRLIHKILCKYRKAVFKKRIRCPHKKFALVGKITLINTNIKIGENVIIYPDVMFFGDGPIIIGDNVAIGNGTIIYSSKFAGVFIGSNTMIAAQSYIIDTDYGISKDQLMREQKKTHAPIHIGQDVWIAANVTVLKGSIINDGAVIAAKALVKGEIPQNAIVAGIPAKVIKYRE